MMVNKLAPCSRLWFLLTIIFSAQSLPPTNGDSIAYVRPSGASYTTCPDQPCLSFSDYAREKDQYFLDGTTFMFLSGVHHLDLGLRLENVSSISLTPLEGAGSAQLLLGPKVNITWLDSINVSITGLNIFLSGLPSDSDVPLFTSLTFNSVIRCSLSRLNFFGNDSWQSTAIWILSTVANVTDVTVSGALSSYGAALISFNSTINFIGNNSFVNNTATGAGGAMYISKSVVSFLGNVSFINNIVLSIADLASGGAIYSDASLLSFGGSALFMKNNIVASSNDNAYSQGGGIFALSNSTLAFEGTSLAIFRENAALDYGGAISIIESDLIMNGNAIFEANRGTSGGAISGEFNSKILCNCRNYRNFAILGSGLSGNLSDVRIIGNILFLENYANFSGGAIYAAVDSIICLSSLHRFQLNTANKGGAIAIDSSSKLVLATPLHASFIENNASVGGAIFYEDIFSPSQCGSSRSAKEEINYCFIELESTANIQLSFLNNTATSAGTVLYGGNLDNCRLYTGGGFSDSCGNRVGGDYSDNAIATICEISESVSFDNNKTSSISSDPLRLCFCNNANLDCYDRSIAVARGKEFTFMVLITGQHFGIVPSMVRVSLDNEIQISAAQRIQSTGKECTPITYRLSSAKNTSNLTLFPDGPCRDTGISRRKITINFLPCPDGFTLDGSECICEQRLRKYTNGCNVDDNSIMRASNTFWMGAVYENGTYGGLILHPGCPFDYCVDTPVLVSLDDLDNQCDHNHSGTLCGGCANGYSATFGTLHCLPCTNAYIALVIPFALAGIALVAMLLLLNISVASGTINGLIFYANVIQVNRSIFFPPEATNFLTVFIAWLNLDLGIETCFFDGMDAYIFTWLQFVFPLYVWFLIGLIIVISRFSIKIAKSLGKNPVTSLATLLHLSYSKILRTIIVALSFTILDYPGKNRQIVWLFDGNVPYFRSASHVVLGVVAIVVLLFLFLPYTLFLLVGHWLQAYSDRWIFSWLNKIKPLMDAYHAPYKKESRYWTGLLLLVRCALFLTFAFNTLGNASGNLLAISSVTAGLAILAWLSSRIYENVFNDFVEAAFLLNLCILAVGTYHVKEIEGNQVALSYTLVGVAFVFFVCIMLYHVYLRLRTSALWKRMPKPNSKVVLFGHNKESDDDEVQDGQQDTEVMQAPTASVVELREPLLA